MDLPRPYLGMIFLLLLLLHLVLALILFLLLLLLLSSLLLLLFFLCLFLFLSIHVLIILLRPVLAVSLFLLFFLLLLVLLFLLLVHIIFFIITFFLFSLVLLFLLLLFSKILLSFFPFPPFPPFLFLLPPISGSSTQSLLLLASSSLSFFRNYLVALFKNFKKYFFFSIATDTHFLCGKVQTDSFSFCSFDSLAFSQNPKDSRSLSSPHKKMAASEKEEKKIRSSYLNYGKHSISEEDIEEVVTILRSNFLTCGPQIAKFEEAVLQYTNAVHAVAVVNGTAALHAAMFALGVGKGDEVIVPDITFVASANAAVYCGATVVFAEVDWETLCIDPSKLKGLITPKTKVVVCVDMWGNPCDYDEINKVLEQYQQDIGKQQQKIFTLADAAHSLGATYKGRQAGTLADITTFSFHPVKNITTGEGGMVVTNNREFADRARGFRSHGITMDAAAREKSGVALYDVSFLGYNYRMTDLQCALGISQLKRLDSFLKNRRLVASWYRKKISSSLSHVEVFQETPESSPAYHIFSVKIPYQQLGITRSDFIKKMRAENIGVNVHYHAIHLFSLYQEMGYSADLCPLSTKLTGQLLTLPCHPHMEESDVDDVIKALVKCCPDLQKKKE